MSLFVSLGLCSGIPKQQDSEEFQSAALTSLSDALMNVPVEGHPALLRNNPVDELFGVELTTTCVSALSTLLSTGVFQFFK